MAELSLQGISKKFSNASGPALKDLSIEIRSGEFLALLGPSGCGKTTALRIVAGLEDPTTGSVILDGEDITDKPESERDVAMVFQTYALYPHMTVAENLSFPLRVSKTPRDQIDSRIREVSSLLGLADLMDRKPSQLSGGQRQRVAMGRAIVRKPQVFLMDEPLSNLDAKLRAQMRAELFHLQRELGITTLYVTHDQAEAMVLGHRVVVLRDGEVQQLGPPQDVYNRPANLFVATFVGSPAMNMLYGQINVEGSTCSVRLGEQQIVLDEIEAGRHRSAMVSAGREVVVGIRPEALTVGAANPGRDLSVVVETVEEIGSDTYLHLALARSVAAPTEFNAIAENLEEDVPQLTLGGDREVTIVGRFEPTLDYKVGDRLNVTLKRGGLSLFDATDASWIE